MIKHEVLENMSKYGGSFVKTLSLLHRQADRLEKTFENYFKEYERFNKRDI